MKKFMKTQIGRFIAGLLALLIVIAVTIGVNHLSFLKADVTLQRVMSMSETSREAVEKLTKDVVISYIATDSSKELWVEELAMKYAAATSRITYEMVDPSSNKAIQLAAQAGEALSENALVVTCGDRSTVISAEEQYSVVYNQMYLYFYGEYVAEEQYFMADERLVNAISYVTRDDLPVIYALTGHGETAAGSYMLNQFGTNSIIVRTLNLTGEVPADAAAVMIIAPTADLTNAETEALMSYLKNGGDLILTTGYMMEAMPNLQVLTSYYGMDQVYGAVLDVGQGYSYSAEYPQFLMPDVMEHAVTATLNELGAKPMISLAGAMTRNSIVRSGLTVTELLTTSAESYMKTSLSATTLEKEDGDPVGPFVVGMAAEEGETQVVWFGSGTFLVDDEISVSGGANLYLLSDALAWMMPVGERIAIEAGDLLASSLSVPAEETNMIIILMFVPALLAFIVGLIMKRKR